MDDHSTLLARIARLETLVAHQAAVIAAQAARIAELEAELRTRRGGLLKPGKVGAMLPALGKHVPSG